jgi:hypothetical protein
VKSPALVLVIACACSGPAARTRSPAAPATIDPQVEPLVDAWAQAIGGRPKLAALGAVHVRGRYTKGGITGTIDLWETPHGERREELQLAFLHELRVFDGARGWLVDRNGEVRDLDGFELDDQRALAFRDSFAPLVADHMPGVVTGSGVTGQLVLTARNGHRPETVSFSADHRPAEVVRRDGEKWRTTQLDDWREVAGVAMPFHLHEDNGDPHDAVDIQITSIERGAPPAFTRPADRVPDMTGTAEVPIEIGSDGLVFVAVEVNGTPMSFVLDTGAESTVLSSSRLAKLGLTATGTFAAGAGGGDVTLGYVPHVTFKVGGASVSDQIASVIDLSGLEALLERTLDGILGYDFLSRFVVELDYKHHRLRLRDRASFRHAPGTPVPITLEDSTPFVDATIELPGLAPIPGHFTLDTGCSCQVSLFSPFTNEHHLLAAVPGARNDGFSAGAGGETHQVSAPITSLRVGDKTIAKPIADFGRDTTGATADPESAGLIGAIVWRQFVLVLDYQRKRMWLD